MSYGNASSNATNVEDNNGAHQSDTIIYSTIYVTAMISNFLLIAVILRVKRLRSQANVLILHLAVCDIVRATFGIAFQLKVQNSAYYPYGYIGCKTIQPIATHSTNAIVLTLVCIAIERYIAVSLLTKPLTKPIIIGTIISIHVISFLAITPYMIFLKYYAAPYYVCYELWPNVGSRQAYTMFLFLLQYGLPLPIMALLYASTWWKIRKQNKSIINMSEDYERKIHRSNDTSVLLTGEKQVESSSRNNNIGQTYYAHKPTSVSYQIDSDEDEEKRKSLLFKKRNSIYDSLLKNETVTSLRKRVQHLKRKKSYMSETALLRHKQTVRTFKMFFIVVAVFAIFSLPNQIVWLVMDFSENQMLPPAIIFRILNYLSFTNAILNCWIYGGFNKSFRKAYREFIISVFSCGMYKADPFYSTPKTRTTTVESDPEQIKTQRKFSEMFQDQINNFEKYRHLYKLENEDKVDIKRQAESTTNIKQKIEKRKKSLANFLVSLQPSSRKNSCQMSPTRMRKKFSFSSLAQNKLSSSKGKLSMIPPIIPFTEAAGNVIGGEQASKTKSRRATTQPSNTRYRRYSEDNSNRRKRKSSWRYSLFTPKSTTFSWNTKNTSSPPSSSIHIEEVSTVQVTMQQVRTVTITTDGKQTCYHETVNKNHQDNKNMTENVNLPKSPFSMTVSKCRNKNSTKPLHNSASSVKETATNQATVKQNSENKRAVNDDIIKRNPSLKKLKISQLVSKNLSKFECDSDKQPLNKYNTMPSRTRSVPVEPVVHQKVRRRATLDPPDLEQLDTRPAIKDRPVLSRAEVVVSKTRELKSFKNTNSTILNKEYSHIFNNSANIKFNRKTSLTQHVMNQCSEERHTIL